MDVLPASAGYRFGRFLLEPGHRVLSAGGVPVTLSSRGFDLLLLLIERRADVVAKDEIMARVWPGTFVEENNLAVQISALRRALGEPEGRACIATVPGRGYRFTGDVSVEERPAARAAGVPTAPPVEKGPGRGMRAWPLWAGLAVVVVAGGLWAAVARRPWSAAAARMSLAVLPFRNIGGDPAQDYLADAIGDDLTTDLSHLPGSTVIARESASVYKGRAVSAQAIGRALLVRYLLEGSVGRAGGVLHVNAALIDTASGAQRWASTFDVVPATLDQARAQIVRHLASVLDFTLVQIESARSLHERPDNPDAVDLFLRARSLLDRDDSLAGLAGAQGLLERAMAAEPDFADAQALLGAVLLRKIADYDDADEWRDHARAVSVIARASALAPQDPLAITARGRLAWEDEQCAQAVASYRLALSIDPDDTQARDGLAQCDHDLGRMQAMIDDLLDVLRIDPVAPSSAARQNMIGLGYLMLGRLPEALDWLQRARAGIADPQAAPAPLSWQEGNLLGLIVAAWQSGDHARAASLFADYARLCPHRTVWRLASFDTKALAAMPGRRAFFASLAALGMPAYADEHRDFGVAMRAAPVAGGALDATPLEIPGARRIDTAALAGLIATAAPPVLDTGRGGASLPGAVLVWPPGVWGDRAALLRQAAGSVGRPDRPVVVMGDGPFGWSSYDAALELVSAGYRNVLWYRGGEEAWAASGHPAVDRRPE